VTMPSRYAVRSTANPQATDEAERCTVFAQKRCEHAGKLVMPQATDKAERLCSFCCTAV